jgi:hypothetical protein
VLKNAIKWSFLIKNERPKASLSKNRLFENFFTKNNNFIGSKRKLEALTIEQLELN